MLLFLPFLLHPSYLSWLADIGVALPGVGAFLPFPSPRCPALLTCEQRSPRAGRWQGWQRSRELAAALFSFSSQNGSRLAVGAAGALLYGALLLYTSGFPHILPSEFPGCGLCHSLCSPSLPPPISWHHFRSGCSAGPVLLEHSTLDFRMQ